MTVVPYHSQGKHIGGLHPPATIQQRTITIKGIITAFRYNPIFEQLEIELGITGSSYAFWSRSPLTIRRFNSWYSTVDKTVGIGTKVSIDTTGKLELIGFR